jgi:hypothetical protein
MNFREYRPKQTIRAAEITEEKLRLYPAGAAPTSELTEHEFSKGDYAENQGGILLGWKKAEFEAKYLPTRAPRQVKTSKQGRKPKAPGALNGPFVSRGKVGGDEPQ